MAIRFILGRAGTGKTHHCMQAILTELAEQPVHGPRIFMLVPEQSTLQVEYQLTMQAPGQVIHRAEVLSFHRLTQRMLSARGKRRHTLSSTARTMVLRLLAKRLTPSLRYYRHATRMTGFIQRLNSTLDELLQEAMEPSDLRRAAESCLAHDEQDNLSSAGMDTLSRHTTAAKLADIADIYADYLTFLSWDRLDPSLLLAEARLRISDAAYLQGAKLWVDGFASFTRQELLTLVSLARVAQSMEITLLLDERSMRYMQQAEGQDRQAHLFHRTMQTLEHVTEEMRDAGVTVDAPLFLEHHALSRFTQSHALARIESSFHGGDLPADAVATGEQPSVRFVSLPSLRLEAEFAASVICDWVRRPDGWRYRDIAVIVRDIDTYHELLANAFSQRSIPAFIDRRRPINHHPLVEFLRCAVSMAIEPFTLGTIRRILKTDLLPIDIDHADILENYLIEHGVTGIDGWYDRPWPSSRRQRFATKMQEDERHQHPCYQLVLDTKGKINDCLGPWLTVARGGEPASTTNQPHAMTGAAWYDALTQLLLSNKVDTRLAAWVQQAQQQGDVELATFHQQVWDETFGLLDDLRFAFQDTPLTADELLSTIEAGFSQSTLGLIPPTLDQVLVGSVERSRQPQLKGVILLGFSEGTYPQQFQEDCILHEDDRTILREQGLRLSPSSMERMGSEALTAYIALTRSSEQLIITYPRLSSAGRENRPSPYVSFVTQAIPELCEEHLADPVSTRSMWDVITKRDAIRRLAIEFRTRPPLEADDPEIRGRWNGLYEWLRHSDDETTTLMKQAFRSLLPEEHLPLSVDTVQQLFKEDSYLSVSKLESFAACPFQFYARHTLALQPRQDAALERIDVGKLHHAILEHFFSSLPDKQQRLADMSRAEIDQHLQTTCTYVSDHYVLREQTSTSRDAFTLRQTAEAISHVLHLQAMVERAGTFTPTITELPFGMKEAATLPPLEIILPNNRKVLLRGVIDRVDITPLNAAPEAPLFAATVIDYKTGDVKLDYSMVYHGLSLQLLSYALVIRANADNRILVGEASGRIIPIAMLYLVTRPSHIPLEVPPSEPSAHQLRAGLPKLRGLIHEDYLNLLETSLDAGYSNLYGVFVTKGSGKPSPSRSDTLTAGAFEGALAHAQEKLTQLSLRVLSGEIRPFPYRVRHAGPCGWCDYKATCGLDLDLTDFNYLEPISKQDAVTYFESIGKQPR